jgi:hypothetical protein
MFLIIVLSLLFAGFYYCQAIKNGMSRRRWAVIGFIFGPLAWPLFCMQTRIKITQRFGVNNLYWKP